MDPSSVVSRWRALRELQLRLIYAPLRAYDTRVDGQLV